MHWSYCSLALSHWCDVLWIYLTHWGRVMHKCVSKLTTIGSDNGSSPVRRQAIIWTNAGILLIGPLGTNFSEILIEIHIFSFKKMHLKTSSAKWRLFCLGLNESRGYRVDMLIVPTLYLDKVFLLNQRTTKSAKHVVLVFQWVEKVI